MYNNLLNGAKRRILQEVENAFLNHPQFAGKVIVTNRFPNSKERVQYGVVLRNTYASQIRMSPDNYLANLSSHVNLARLVAPQSDSSNMSNFPGLGIEWVRENSDYITKLITEDLSSQVDHTQTLYHTSNIMTAGPGNTFYADNQGQISVSVNGSQVSVIAVNGGKKEFILQSPPSANSTMQISYWVRTLVSPGIFRIEFTQDNELQIHPLYTVDKEVLFEHTTGLETVAQLEMSPMVSTPPPALYPNSDKLFLYHINAIRGDFPIQLIRGVDYTINSSGLITFLTPVQSNFKMTANYRYLHPGMVIGPYTFTEYQELHEGLPGVVMCLGRRAKKGDWQVVNVSQFREPQARIYGGHWDMFMTLSVISKDTRQVEEMVDQIVNWLWAVRKNQLELEGITLTRVEPTGESEEPYSDSVTEFYFESTVDISVQTEWQKFVPYLNRIENFSINEQIFTSDTLPVIKSPVIGYEHEI
jgi:hypothetical protein